MVLLILLSFLCTDVDSCWPSHVHPHVSVILFVFFYVYNLIMIVVFDGNVVREDYCSVLLAQLSCRLL